LPTIFLFFQLPRRRGCNSRGEGKLFLYRVLRILKGGGKGGGGKGNREKERGRSILKSCIRRGKGEEEGEGGGRGNLAANLIMGKGRDGKGGNGYTLVPY